MMMSVRPWSLVILAVAACLAATQPESRRPAAPVNAIEEQFDALLYLGSLSTAQTEPLSPKLCAEPGYVTMRLNRIALAGLPPPEVERVKKLCSDKAR